MTTHYPLARSVLLVAISLLWCGLCFGQQDGSFATSRASVLNQFGSEHESVRSYSDVPSCLSLSLLTEERRSCLIEEGNAFVHVWGADGSDELTSKFSVHNKLVAAIAAAKGKAVRVAINLPLEIPECTRCPRFMIAPMDVSPEETVAKAIEDILAILDFDVKAKLDITGTKAALTAMVKEAQVLQFKMVLKDLNAHLQANGIDIATLEGSTSSFLGSVRFMQATALRDWNTNKGSQISPEKTVCEVGFNAGHSALLWLLAGASRVISFELGKHKYSQLANEWLSARFPGRLLVVMGDSLQTVPTFHTMFTHEKCDIVFVDGGHTSQQAWEDLTHFKELVDLGRNASNGHILLVDDTNMPGVGEAWAQAQAQGIAVEDGHVLSHNADVNDFPFSSDLRWIGNFVTESPGAIRWPWPGKLSYGRYLP